MRYSRPRVPLHLGNVEQPQNSPRGPVRLTIGDPHLGHKTKAEGGMTLASVLAPVAAAGVKDEVGGT